MTDDMLGAYAAAQLMVGNLTQSTSATLRVTAMAVGEIKYSIAVFAVNIVVILLFLIEIIRTRGWKDLPDFDVADVRHLVIAASEGGMELGNIAFGQERDIGDVSIRYATSRSGRFAIIANSRTEDTALIEHVGVLVSRKTSITDSENMI